MGAQEEELQRVVCGLGRSRRRLDLDPLLAIASRGLGALLEELAPGDRDQPALRVGGLLVRPRQRSLDDASCTASSAVAKSTPRRTRTPITAGVSSRSSSSSSLIHLAGPVTR